MSALSTNAFADNGNAELEPAQRTNDALTENTWLGCLLELTDPFNHSLYYHQANANNH